MRSMIKVATLAAMGSFGVASAAHVDFLDADPFSLEATGSLDVDTATSVPVEGGGANGGSRDLFLQNSAGASGTATAVLGAGANPNPGSLGSQNDSPGVVFDNQTDGQTLLAFAYGAGGDLNANFLDIPIPGCAGCFAWTRFEIALQDVAGATSIGVNLSSGGGSESAVLNAVIGGMDTVVSFQYSDFLAMNPNLDLRDIDNVVVTAEADAGSTATFNDFFRRGQVQIPVPGALILMIAGLTLLGRQLRRG